MRAQALTLLFHCCCAGAVFGDDQLPAPEPQPEVSGGITVTGLAAEGGRANPVAGAALDLVLDHPLGAGALVVTIEGNTAQLPGSVPAVYAGADTNVGTVQINGNNGGLQISEFKYRWDLGPGRALTLGLLDVTAYVDLANTANDEKTQFLNTSLVNNQAIAFPDYALGVAWADRRGDTQIFALVTGSHGLGDNRHKTYGDLAELDARGKRVFGVAGLRQPCGIFSAELGAWGNNADHAPLNGGRQDHSNYGAYGVFGGAWERAAFDLRAGYANPEVDPATAFFSVSLGFDLQDAVTGVGWAVTRLAAGARTAGTDDARVAEWYLRVPTGPIDSTLDLQYVENPGFDATIPASRIVGMRFRYAF